ncbi:hypothetical protein TWF106_003329 [Orbilia oligospora]|uniref:Uncharacterized protein n=1 Tax=Orbilia oligospora TaxID=2813651 RepID=A0A6G1LT38_ORBOL|nr:hypothetical protein TWF679_000966 [Orbilia oligospora]KAF3224886.1 hypothetical protein TWF106_003329 [Orbilia oligospora]KAF3231720.1 hypothetical protein TWF192_003425 [Orbilia oligospora]
MTSTKVLESRDLYTVGWIATLPIERAAATELLDEEHAKPLDFAQSVTDTNSYTWGRIGDHNIVIGSLPAGSYGTTSATATALPMLSSFPNIRFGLLVGIGAGIPRPDQDRDIRLGDVAVSQPKGRSGGVIQYDLRKAGLGQTSERRDFLNRPPEVLLKALANLQSDHERHGSKVAIILEEMVKRNPRLANLKDGYVHQGFVNDRLFEATYDHVSGADCQKCDPEKQIEREERDSTEPEIHYGTIASGNTLIKDAATRDMIEEVVGEECICFEMAAAGLMNIFPCLVIRGICDYADSHKNDRWQRYAAAIAAAFAKELIGYVPSEGLQKLQKVADILRTIEQVAGNVAKIRIHNERIADKIYLAKLPMAEGAAFDSHQDRNHEKCHQETRIDLLRQVNEWYQDPQGDFHDKQAGTANSSRFKDINGKHQVKFLHEIPEPVVEHDISVYLRYELNRIRDDYNKSVSEYRRLLIAPEGHPESAIEFYPDGWLSSKSSRSIRYAGSAKTPFPLFQDKTSPDAATGAVLRVLSWHPTSIKTLKFSPNTFSPDSKLLASGSSDETIKLWDISTRATLEILERHTRPITAVAFSPDGKVLASGSRDGSVRLWDVHTGKALRTLGEGVYEVYSVAFSPDGKLLAWGVADRTIRVWDLNTGVALQELDTDGSPEFSPDEPRVPKEKAILEALNGCRHRSSAIGFSSDSKIVVLVSSGNARAWAITLTIPSQIYSAARGSALLHLIEARGEYSDYQVGKHSQAPSWLDQ